MTSDVVSPRKRDNEQGRQLSPEQAAAAAMVAEAKARGLELTGPNGLLKLFTKNVLENALNEELTEHLGHPKHQAEPGRESMNVRNGSRAKTVISDAAGEVVIDVPRDREGTFEPQIVEKTPAAAGNVDGIVLSMYAKGLTTGKSPRTLPKSTGPRCRRRRSLGLPTPWWPRCRSGPPAHWMACTSRCSLNGSACRSCGGMSSEDGG
jgi:Transposase, Mutator family